MRCAGLRAKLAAACSERALRRPSWRERVGGGGQEFTEKQVRAGQVARSPARSSPVRETRAVCRRKGSSIVFCFFVWRRSWPAAYQSGGYQRQEQFVMA